LFWTVAAAVLVADWLTKFIIVRLLPLGSFQPYGGIELIPGFLNLAHVGNTGAAWSILTGRSVLLAFVAIATLVAIYLWRRSLLLRLKLVQFAFGLLCGGIVGNLFDRLYYGHVIDFIDLRFGTYIYPTFNIADSGICVGVFLYLWHTLRKEA
jgi:signal peptidase II